MGELPGRPQTHGEGCVPDTRHITFWGPAALKPPVDGGRTGEPGQAAGTRTQAALMERPAGLIRCRRCLAAVARPGDAIAVDGGHEHTFANPHGIVFTIGCFAEARGCGTAGGASPEFTWFRGFEWRVGIC
jgi:hypothetical protein